MKYLFYIVINLLAVGLIGFGVQGCALEHDVYGWAVFAGLCMLTIPKFDTPAKKSKTK